MTADRRFACRRRVNTGSVAYFVSATARNQDRVYLPPVLRGVNTHDDAGGAWQQAGMRHLRGFAGPGEGLRGVRMLPSRDLVTARAIPLIADRYLQNAGVAVHAHETGHRGPQLSRYCMCARAQELPPYGPGSGAARAASAAAACLQSFQRFLGSLRRASRPSLVTKSRMPWGESSRCGAPSNHRLDHMSRSAA
jgi:hypothetical protein